MQSGQHLEGESSGSDVDMEQEGEKMKEGTGQGR